jgi:hypothetical protein
MLIPTPRFSARLLALLAAAGLLAGCGDDNGTSYGSCTVSDSGTGTTLCLDFTGAAYAVSSAASTVCSSLSYGSTTGGTFSASACSTANRAGSCTVGTGQATEYVFRYLTGFNATTGQAACTTASGSWSAN